MEVKSEKFKSNYECPKNPKCTACKLTTVNIAVWLKAFCFPVTLGGKTIRKSAGLLWVQLEDAP